MIHLFRVLWDRLIPEARMGYFVAFLGMLVNWSPGWFKVFFALVELGCIGWLYIRLKHHHERMKPLYAQWKQEQLELERQQEADAVVRELARLNRDA